MESTTDPIDWRISWRDRSSHTSRVGTLTESYKTDSISSFWMTANSKSSCYTSEDTRTGVHLAAHNEQHQARSTVTHAPQVTRAPRSSRPSNQTLHLEWRSIAADLSGKNRHQFSAPTSLTREGDSRSRTNVSSPPPLSGLDPSLLRESGVEALMSRRTWFPRNMPCSRPGRCRDPSLGFSYNGPIIALFQA